MAKVDKQMLIKFGPEEPKYKFTQTWPKGSQLLKIVALQQGVFTFFLVPDIMAVDASGNLEGENWTFIIAGPQITPDSSDEFIDIVTVITEVPPEALKEQQLPSDYQAIVIFPIFLRSKE